MTINPLKWFKRSGLESPAGWLSDALGVVETTSGVSVGDGNLMNTSGVFACVRNLSEDVAKLPLILYRRLPGGGKERATDDPLYRLLHDSPNDEMTAFSFRQAIMAQALLFGTGYAEIERSNVGNPIALWPIESKRMTPKRDTVSGKLYFLIDGRTRIEPSRLFVLPGFGANGIVGEMIGRLGRESIGLTIAAEKFGASFFGKACQPSGALEVPIAIGSNQKLRDSLIRSVESRHSNASGGQSNRMMFLWDGVKYTKVSTDPENAQFLETRIFQIEEVARWFRMPPHKIGQVAASKGWNTQEQSAIDYVTDTLMPWLVRIEQEIGSKLIGYEKQDYLAEHLVDALLRGDALTRAQSLQIQFQNGAITANEWRAIENRNPIGESGDMQFVMSSLTTMDKAVAEVIPEPTPVNNGKPRILVD